MKNSYSTFLFIGNFGTNKNPNGQNIKTREIRELFEKKYYSFKIFDTTAISIDSVRSFVKNLKVNKVILVLGRKGLLFFLIFFDLIDIFLGKRKKLIIFLVGGWFSDLYDKSFILNKINILKRALIYAESEVIVNSLKSRGLNSKYFPNFRSKYDVASVSKKPNIDFLKFIFLSRVVREKGIFEACDLVIKLSKNRRVHLDIYGPIDNNIKDELHRKIENHKNISYLGVVNPKDSVSLISLYHFLLLPTFYEGECMPGVVVESYYSGTPVISSNFKYMSEFVITNQTGCAGNLANFVNESEDWINEQTQQSYIRLQQNSTIFFNKKFSHTLANKLLDETFNG